MRGVFLEECSLNIAEKVAGWYRKRAQPWIPTVIVHSMIVGLCCTPRTMQYAMLGYDMQYDIYPCFIIGGTRHFFAGILCVFFALLIALGESACEF